MKNGKMHLLTVIALVALLTCALGCKKDDDDAPWYQGPPLYVVAFDEVSDAAGFTGVTATYVAWGDYDGDANDDLILDGHRLFKNNGDGTFTDTTSAAGIDATAGGGGAAWADIDNDGYLDLFCSGYEDASSNSLDRLYYNNGDGTFNDITTSAGVSDNANSMACAWGDFNGDGDIDLYVANHETWPGSGVGDHDRLYINNGNSTFTNASVSSGIAAASALIGNAVCCCDYDENGTLDIFVANDLFDQNFLWQNDGSGVFTDVGMGARVAGENENYSGNFGLSTGAAWGDYDNDLDFDLLVTNELLNPPSIYNDNSHLYMHLDGVPEFSDLYPDSFINTGYEPRCPAWFDYNNDTQLDFFVCSSDGWGQLYNGHTTGAFYNVAAFAAISAQNPLGCAIADYNNDGRPDLFVTAADRVYLYKNNHDQYNWLKVKLVGNTTNKAGIGSVVRVTCPCVTPDTISRIIGGSNGTGCQDSLVALFGMGAHGGPYTVDILWSETSATTQQETDMAINQLHVISQP